MQSREAITKTKGPCVILAGAGTGKTHTIVEKVKYLVNEKIYPAGEIVCITFSNEAANNLSLRISNLLADSAEEKPVIRTFHAFSADLLRTYGEAIGINKDFKILDPDQAKVILHRSLRVNVANCHKYISTIGIAKDLGIDISQYQDYLEKRELEYLGVDLAKRLDNLGFELQTLHLRYDSKKRKILMEEIKKIKDLIELRKFTNAWNAYEKIKIKNNHLDYSDLNKNALSLVKKNADISKSFSYLIIDEFQDTNKLQLEFAVALARHNNITVVGDLNQSIYRFRGAYKNNLEIFKKAFNVKQSDIFTLDKSYRSSNKVLKIAHQLISLNYKNKEDCFFVQNFEDREGCEVKTYELVNSKEEARKVVEIIKEEIASGRALSDICIMFRAHQQGRIFKKLLEQEGISFVSVAKASLLKQKSVKTAHDFLVIIDKIKRKQTGGEEAWWDLIYQLDFKRSDLIEIGREIKKFSKRKSDVDEVAAGEENISSFLLNRLDKLSLSDKGKMVSRILIDKIKEMLTLETTKISEVLKEVYKIAGLLNEQKTRKEKEVILNLNRFYEVAKVHEDLYDSDIDNFLHYLGVLENLGIEMEASTLEEEGVRLMTSHSTKGLEFGVVIVTNLSQGRFPIDRYMSNSLVPTQLLPEVQEEISHLSDKEKEEFIGEYEKRQQLLEERRLAYVSFTRAKEKLYLTFAQEYGGKQCMPSQFLFDVNYKQNADISYEIDNEKKYVDNMELEKIEPRISSILHADDMESAINELDEKKTQKEEHQRFSPSALLLFQDCQKEFEYKYVYNMPEKKSISWEAMRLGSFVHLVLEKGVSERFKKVEEFISLSKEMAMEVDWESIDTNEAQTLIRVFFERNKGRYNEHSKTEEFLSLKLADLDFIGFADRIDFSDLGCEIIDYKTGKTNIAPKHRNWQLGFYALAAEKQYGKVRKVVLDMLKQERPLEFEIDYKGNAKCVSSQYIDGFNIYSVRDELIAAAKQIKEAYVKGFKACTIEDNCDFCNEYVYKL